MRPIDADKFKEYIKVGYESHKNELKSLQNIILIEKVTDGFLKDIDEQPTIPFVTLLPLDRYCDGKRLYIIDEWTDAIKDQRVTSVHKGGEWAGKIERLQEYESLGLTPEQIREMDKLYLEKCEEINKLKDGLQTLLEKLKHIRQTAKQ